MYTKLEQLVINAFKLEAELDTLWQRKTWIQDIHRSRRVDRGETAPSSTQPAIQYCQAITYDAIDKRHQQKLF